MKNIWKIGLIGMFITTFFAMPAMAQLDLGLDVASRYVWRGTDFGASPSIQPDISYTSGGFTIGSWGAFATNGNPAGTELDFYASYAFETSAGSFELSVTDYTFPEAPTGNYFAEESHFIELGVGYSGTESFPISLSTGVFVTNDDDYSIYSEVGYSVSNVDLFFGFTPAASALYGTTKAGVINTGIGTSREIKVTDSFSFSISGSVIFNPYANDAFMLFGISL